MSELLNKDIYLVKEHLGIFKASNNYDIYDPETGAIILECREENLGSISKILRFTDYKRMTPFHLEIRTPQGETLITVKRGVSIFLSTVQVFDAQNELIGMFKQKFFSIGGKFDVLDPDERFVCSLKGKWTGWEFKFISEEQEFAQVSKKWTGLGKELFTSADNYVLNVKNNVPKDSPIRSLILAAILCIDMVLKE